MFILASKPPRRADLLRQIGAKFTVEESNAREFTGAKADKSPAEIALANAKLKALDVSEKAKDKNLPVLGADTVVVLDEVIYGKPKDHEDAKEMLRKLSGKTHEVITGMVLVTKGKSYPAAETTRNDRRRNSRLCRYGRTHGQSRSIRPSRPRRRLHRRHRRILFKRGGAAPAPFYGFGKKSRG